MQKEEKEGKVTIHIAPHQAIELFGADKETENLEDLGRQISKAIRGEHADVSQEDVANFAKGYAKKSADY